ncbi:L,D-transpeptidase family protein [Phosphitispora sp. TUW77]|uniref:L,D-transpeptidase family protein n=1 Tax=Phosphitispora sp. TUW77 TaxID=3152361 RepID=UPI003AB5DB7B
MINKKVNKLAFLKNDEVIRIFPVATGRQPDYTPEGNFKVVQKLVNPYYNKLKIPGGSPRNPLGVRWLGLDAKGTSGGTYGIHGTNNPGSIGRYISAGCIRMHNSDAIWLYDRTPLYTPVEIINREWDLEQLPVTLVLDGQPLSFASGSGAYLVNSRAMVPLRALAEKTGCKVDWHGDRQEAVVTGCGKTITFKVNSTVITAGGRTVKIDVPVKLKNNKVFVHVRAVGAVLGYQVSWEGKTRTVSLESAY